jgi:selenide,water dikinase
MQPASPTVLRDIVLIGGGHSHAIVLRDFAMRPMPGVRLTIVCTDTDTPYSGMLPGYIAGHYSFDDVHIDIRRLATFAGARYFHDQVIGIDRTNRTVLCRNRPAIPYDALSINVGATPKTDDIPGATDFSVPVKPIRQFNQRWLNLLDRIRSHEGMLTLAIVGAGAGGVELTLAMQYRLSKELRALGRPADRLSFHLFSADATILPTHNTRVQRAFMQTLQQRGIQVHVNARVNRVHANQVQLHTGQNIHADEILWVTQAGGPGWLRESGLALDGNDFIKLRPSLQTETDPAIFAAGDCASLTRHSLEKAGVFAVRMGKPLAQNLRHFLTGRPLRVYRPQSKWLALISTGDRHAVASRGALYARGNWVWRWKDHIDQRFMRMLTTFPDTMPEQPSPHGTQIVLDPGEQAQAISAIAMRCGGCGAKVGANVLSRALAGIEPLQSPDVLVGLHAPDDAAVVRVPPGKAMVHTVDFFRAFIDDPYLLGRIAANHALGDIFAMGAQPHTATAIATVPPGLEAKVQDTVFQLMSGAVQVLNEAGCSLVGGHTGEGQELALGFAVNGLINESMQGLMTKGGMRPGDALLLTKPLGTGTLFAANGQLKARGRWIDAALESMQVSNQAAAACLINHGATACTDLTGFGLLGHLVEMTRPSGVDAELYLNALPVLDGAEQTAALGILSSLQPANVRLRRAIRNQEQAVQHPRYALLFDPQTAGGLLASVPQARADEAVQALHTLGYTQAVCIGRVLEQADDLAPVVARLD